MSIILPLFLSTFFQGLPPAPPVQAKPESHNLVVVPIKDAKTLAMMDKLGLDLAGCTAPELPTKEVEVIATQGDIKRMTQAGLHFRVAIRNLEDSIEQRLSRYNFPMTLTPAVGKGAMGGHYTLAQITAILDSFAKNHPKICAKKISLGKSIEGRDIWMVKISDNVNVDENEPEVLFDAVHHAREPLSVTTTLLFMDWLVSNYGTNPEATRLVNTREMYFVPMLNPDGYEYNRKIRPSGGGMWRKNRRNNGGGIYGVDLNRNWPTGWSAPFGGSSTNPRSDVYRGKSALSEPETKALDNFIKSRKFILGCSAHTYTDVLLRPWGYKRGDPANAAQYKKIEALATKTNGIRAGGVSTLLYIASGSAIDHYHAAYKMFAFTPELGKSSEGGFWPNPTNQVRIANRHQNMFRAFASVAGATIQIKSATLSESGGNGNGKIEPGEKGALVVTLDNQGAAATLTPTTAQLKSLTSGVSILSGNYNFGKVSAFATKSNQASPLLLQVASNFQGVSARLEVAVSYEGNTIKRVLDIPFVTPGTIISDNFEKDLGFARSSSDTATTGRFIRMAPQQTSYFGRVYQPGSDHTPGTGTLCWVTDGRAGSSVGSYDVDGGTTTLLSPLMDLRHVSLPSLSAWIYYSESVNPGDPFRIDVSTNGGTTWTNIYTRNSSTSGWVLLDLKLTSTMTDKVQFRFRAQDLSPSLVEALVDDLAIKGVVAPASTTVLGSGRRGTTLRFALQGKRNGLGLLMLSLGTANLQIPGVQGRLLIDPRTAFPLPAFAYGSRSTIGFDAGIPNDSSLLGKTFYMQQLLIQGTALQLGNRTKSTVR